MPLTLSPDDLLAYMKEHAIPGELLYLEVPTPTVEAAARAVGVRPEQIIKSILFTVNGNPVLAITCGPSYVDRRSIAGLFGVGKKRVKLATPEQVEEISGYEVGAMPPFGNLYDVDTYVAASLIDDKEIAFNAGTHTELIRTQYKDYKNLVKPKVVRISSKYKT